jgi:hypothetical protein
MNNYISTLNSIEDNLSQYELNDFDFYNDIKNQYNKNNK